CYGNEELYTRITEMLRFSLQELVVSDNQTDWVYALFPTLLCLRARGVRIRALLGREGEVAKHGPHRQKLLRAMGVEITEATSETVPVGAVILHPADVSRTTAIVRISKRSSHNIEAVQYEGIIDQPVIDALEKQIVDCLKSDEMDSKTLARVIAGKHDELFS